MVILMVHGIFFINLKISFKIIEGMSGPEAGSKIRDIISKQTLQAWWVANQSYGSKIYMSGSSIVTLISNFIKTVQFQKKIGQKWMAICQLYLVD